MAFVVIHIPFTENNLPNRKQNDEKIIKKHETSDGWHNQIMRIPGMCVKEIFYIIIL